MNAALARSLLHYAIPSIPVSDVMKQKMFKNHAKCSKYYDIGPIHASDVLTRKMFKHYAIASNPVPDVMKHKMFKHHALKWKIRVCTVSTRMNFSNIIEF